MRLPLLIHLFLISLTLGNVQAQAPATSKRASAIRYDLNVKVLAEARRLEVNGTMRIPAANTSRAYIEFSMSERMRDLQVEVLEPIASAPDFQITWRQEGQAVRGAITQAAPYYRARLQVEIQGDEDQRLLHTVTISGARTEFKLPAKFRVQSVTLDPHYLVLRWTPEYHTAAAAARRR